jgi:hypothetical protein
LVSLNQLVAEFSFFVHQALLLRLIHSNYSGVGQTSFERALGRGMISSDICAKLCGSEICDEGSRAA